MVWSSAARFGATEVGFFDDRACVLTFDISSSAAYMSPSALSPNVLTCVLQNDAYVETHTHTTKRACKRDCEIVCQRCLRTASYMLNAGVLFNLDVYMFANIFASSLWFCWCQRWIVVAIVIAITICYNVRLHYVYCVRLLYTTLVCYSVSHPQTYLHHLIAAWGVEASGTSVHSRSSAPVSPARRLWIARYSRSV